MPPLQKQSPDYSERRLRTVRTCGEASFGFVFFYPPF